jgi:hypothetical protein
MMASAMAGGGGVESVDALSDDAVGNKGTKNWPKIRLLCIKHDDVIFKMLRAVDECKCTTEINANNGDYPKGNNWNRLYDHCFGGGSPGQGLLAGHLPMLPSASKLKMKILDIWAYLKKEGSQDFTMVDKELILIASRQKKKHEITNGLLPRVLVHHKVTSPALFTII